MKKMFQLAALGLMVSITAVSCKKKETTTTDGTATTTTSEPVTVDQTTTATTVDTTVNTDADLQRVNDAIKDYPGVKAEVVNGGVVITGDVSSEEARNIKMSVDALQLQNVQYNYIVK